MTWALAHAALAPSRISRRRLVARSDGRVRQASKRAQKGSPKEGALTRRIRDAIKFDLCGRKRRLAAAREPETFGGRREQEDISTASQEPHADPWFSQAHEVALGARDYSSPTAQGSPAAHRLHLQEVARSWAPRRLLSGAASDFPARPGSGAAPSTWRSRTGGAVWSDPISFCSRSPSRFPAVVASA